MHTEWFLKRISGFCPGVKCEGNHQDEDDKQ